MERKQYTEQQMGKLITDISVALAIRTKEKGMHCLVSRHEIMGIVNEEYTELKQAMRENAACFIKAELTDLIVACTLGLLSLECNALDW